MSERERTIAMLTRCTVGQQFRDYRLPLVLCMTPGCTEEMRPAYAYCPTCVLRRDTELITALHKVLDTSNEGDVR